VTETSLSVGEFARVIDRSFLVISSLQLHLEKLNRSGAFSSRPKGVSFAFVHGISVVNLSSVP